MKSLSHRNRGKIETTTAHVYDWSRSCLGTDTSIKSDGVNLVLWDQISPISEMVHSSLPENKFQLRNRNVLLLSVEIEIFLSFEIQNNKLMV